jgi:hypothetical protein
LGTSFAYATGFDKVQQLFALAKKRAELSPSPTATDESLDFKIPCFIIFYFLLLYYRWIIICVV